MRLQCMIYKKHFLAKYCMYLEKQITLQITLINSLPATEFPGWNPPRSSLLCKIDSECPSFYFLVLSFFTRTRKRWLIEIEIFLQQSLTYKESAWTEIKSISWHSISSSQGINHQLIVTWLVDIHILSCFLLNLWTSWAKYES